MTKIINLRQARKTVTRDVARKQGDENAAKFGRTKLQKQLDRDARARAARHLDNHLRDGNGDA